MHHCQQAAQSYLKKNGKCYVLQYKYITTTKLQVNGLKVNLLQIINNGFENSDLLVNHVSSNNSFQTHSLLYSYLIRVHSVF